MRVSVKNSRVKTSHRAMWVALVVLYVWEVIQYVVLQ